MQLLFSIGFHFQFFDLNKVSAVLIPIQRMALAVEVLAFKTDHTELHQTDLLYLKSDEANETCNTFAFNFLTKSLNTCFLTS